MQAASDKAGQAIRDPVKYKPDVLRSIDNFNVALEHFRKMGHNWEVSPIHETTLTSLKAIEDYHQFEAWILETQVQYDRQTFDRLPAQT